MLFIVGLFMLIETAKKGAASPAHIVSTPIETFVVAALIGVLAGAGWLMTLRKVRRLRHGGYASAVMCFILYGVTELAGFSGAITAISFGVVLANGRHFAAATHVIRAGRLAAFSSREHAFLQEMIFVLKTFFFVYLGISMRLDDHSAFLFGGVIVALVYFSRHVIAGALCDRDMPGEHVALTALMVPKGLTAAVPAALPQQFGIAGGEKIQSIAYAVVLLSITLTAMLIALQRVDFVKAAYVRLYRNAN